MDSSNPVYTLGDGRCGSCRYWDKDNKFNLETEAVCFGKVVGLNEKKIAPCRKLGAYRRAGAVAGAYVLYGAFHFCDCDSYRPALDYLYDNRSCFDEIEEWAARKRAALREAQEGEWQSGLA